MNTLTDGERDILRELERDAQPTPCEALQIEHEDLIAAHDAALDRLETLQARMALLEEQARDLAAGLAVQV